MEKLFEGADIDYENRVVSFNPNHEKRIITGNENYTPFPIYDSIRNVATGVVHKTISAFIRIKGSKDRLDGNPVVYAWKGINGWKFKSEKDKQLFVRQFKKITKELNKDFDTIIQIPSKSNLNNEIAEMLIDVVGKKKVIKDFIRKIYKEDVFDHLDVKLIKKRGENFDDIMNLYQRFMDDMPGEVFQYHFVPVYYRQFLTNNFEPVPKSEAIKYAPDINGKRILIIDDTISSGSTISNFCKVFLGTYSPKEAIVFTAFSRLYHKNNPRVKNCILNMPLDSNEFYLKQ